MDRRTALQAIAGLPIAAAIEDVKTVKPTDCLIFTVRDGYDSEAFDDEAMYSALRKAGIDPNRCVVVHGMDVTVLEGPDEKGSYRGR
jgi:hypothetical protein